MYEIEIYTDGSCLKNPGPGGWAYIVLQNGAVVAADCDGVLATTNNKMEIFAAIAAMEATSEAAVLLKSDSNYVVRSINEWLAGWLKIDFRGKKNPEFWKRYVAAAAGRKVQAVWIKAHAGNMFNELCDELAHACAQGKVAEAKARCEQLVASGFKAPGGAPKLPRGYKMPAAVEFDAGAIVKQPRRQISENERAKEAASVQNPRFAGLEQKLDYKFYDYALLERAMRHKSAGKLNNERLEFLGDAVMDLSLAQMLFEDEARYNEGALSKLRAALVNESSFAKIAQSLELGALLELSAAEERNGGRTKPSLLSDAFEAMMGVIYLESGFERAHEVALRLIHQNFEHIGTELIKDYKTRLQEFTQEHYAQLPEYRVLAQSGPDHAKVFTIGVFIDGKQRASATASSKKAAEQAAAKGFWDELKASGMVGE